MGPQSTWALYTGVLQRVRDTGLPLISVTRLDAEQLRTSPTPALTRKEGT